MCAASSMYAQFARARGWPGEPFSRFGTPNLKRRMARDITPLKGQGRLALGTGGQTGRETRGIGGSCDGAVSEGVKVWSANVKNPALDWSELVWAVSGAGCLISAGSHG